MFLSLMNPLRIVFFNVLSFKEEEKKNSPPGIIKFSWIFYLFKLWGTLKHLFDLFLRWEMLSKQDANNFNMKASVYEVKCTKDSY